MCNYFGKENQTHLRNGWINCPLWRNGWKNLFIALLRHSMRIMTSTLWSNDCNNWRWLLERRREGFSRLRLNSRATTFKRQAFPWSPLPSTTTLQGILATTRVPQVVPNSSSNECGEWEHTLSLKTDRQVCWPSTRYHQTLSKQEFTTDYLNLLL